MELYKYSATVVAVIDGDTVDLMTDLGFSVFKRVRVRLGRINAPEISTPEGKDAKQFLSTNLPVGSSVYLESKKYDKYGRSIGEIIFNDVNISDLMLQNGKAVAY
jgi:endonuclease YncB( thermonuclease family)